MWSLTLTINSAASAGEKQAGGLLKNRLGTVLVKSINDQGCRCTRIAVVSAGEFI